jgi:hypothetical protein
VSSNGIYARAWLIGAMAIAAGPVFAQGPNTSNPAPTPATPTGVVTSQQVVNPLSAKCSQQLTNIGIAADGVGLTTTIVGVVAEGVAQAVPPGAEQVAEAAAIGTQVVGLTAQSVALGNEILAANLPSCEQSFTGTVSISAGGVNVTGASIFNSGVGVVGNVAVSGDVTASQVRATQGISAMDGRIWLGDLNGTTYSDGITLGGGALSGAGFGGQQATTGDVTAIAIGNGASAFSVNSVAIGTGANANGTGATAYGANSNANGTNSVALGPNSSATGTNATAFGANSRAAFADSLALGPNSQTVRSGQFVFGGASTTYTMPGITSRESLAAQSGLLQLPTTDAAGNLATDGGATFRAMAKVQAGVAVAMAITPPQIDRGQKFGIRAGWGVFGSSGATSNAFGLSAAGVIGEGLLTKTDRVTLDGGFGFGSSQFMGYSENAVVGGRAGVQYAW